MSSVAIKIEIFKKLHDVFFFLRFSSPFWDPAKKDVPTVMQPSKEAKRRTSIRSSKKLNNVSARRLNSLKKKGTEPNEGIITPLGRYTGQFVVYHKKQYRHGLGRFINFSNDFFISSDFLFYRHL